MAVRHYCDRCDEQTPETQLRTVNIWEFGEPDTYSVCGKCIKIVRRSLSL